MRLGTENKSEFFPFLPYFLFVIVETGSSYVAQSGLELVILLPLPPESWYYRCAPPRLGLLPSF
jgi:hypothetical protein